MNYTWKVIRCWRRSDGMIFKVEYKVFGTKGDLKVTMIDQIRFRQSDSPIAYASVTEENIVSWIKAKLGSTRENKIYALLVKEMTEKESVPVSKGVPWEN